MSAEPHHEHQTATTRRSWFRRHRILLITLAVVAGMALVLVGRPLTHLAVTAWADRHDRKPIPAGRVDDASHLNEVAATVISIPADPQAAERQLADLLRDARQRNLRVSIAGARHSQGGHTLYPGGLVLDLLSFNRVEIDTPQRVVRAQSGALWSQIIPRLDAVGLAVEVMQSDSNFSVGGSLSVNCHGWQPGRPPIAATVKSFRLMLADGSIVRCSRSEQPELFSLALGGYGLFGVILDAEIQVVPNVCYRLERQVVAADDYPARYRELVLDVPGSGLAYGRLCVTTDNFLQEIILTVAREIPAPADGIPVVNPPSISALNRTIFRGTANSEYGKRLRWQAERDLQGLVTPALVTRNELMNGTVDEYLTFADDRTDIIHEYFIPKQQFAPFLARLRDIIPRHACDLLNATVRDVRSDTDTVLRYADQEQFALVLFFTMERSAAADQRMGQLTRELIDVALDLGGRYYLPYRLHATAEQFARAYPQANDFFRAKRRFDPDELFQNEFYRRYAQGR